MGSEGNAKEMQRKCEGNAEQSWRKEDARSQRQEVSGKR